MENSKMQMRQQVLLDHLKPDTGRRAAANLVVSPPSSSSVFLTGGLPWPPCDRVRSRFGFPWVEFLLLLRLDLSFRCFEEFFSKLVN